MGEATNPVIPEISLQSKDHEELLDVIDHLRALGISRYIDLPQLIVCGDQSSGKSSVLEAISGLKFPTKDGLCTRFATELILRRGVENNVAITIVPADDRNDNERAKLESFTAPENAVGDLGALIESAEKAMGLDTLTRGFSNDVLRVEVSGPKQPHLTLVDLPGLFHGGHKAQSVEDAAMVKSLVRSYMRKSRSIILAVVSAKNDLALQIVTNYAREMDPHGARTLGILTKPDTLHEGSASESAFVQLAKNQNVVFRLGWHVLVNRDFNNRDCSTQERDRAEREFFANGVWTSLPPDHVGIGALKPRLSRVLQDQILFELPQLVQDVGDGIDDCQRRLKVLGTSRSTLREQRQHLLEISHAFTSLVKAAIDGIYVDSFFGDPMTAPGYSKRLRAVTQNTLLQFADTMDRRGHAKQIVDRIDDESEPEVVPLRILRSEYIDEVQELMRRTRGCELPGTFNPQIIGELFYDQAKPWTALVMSCKERLLDATKAMLNLVLDDATQDPKTYNGILRHIINPGLEPLRQSLQGKAEEVLKPHQRGHPITYNHYLTDNIQKARADHWGKLVEAELSEFFHIDLSSTNTHYRQNFDVRGLVATLKSINTETNMERHACSEAVACMQAYYKACLAPLPAMTPAASLTDSIQVARKTLVDDFSVLAIEACLLEKLPEIFSPTVVSKLTDSIVEDIAAETEESKVERTAFMKKLQVLEETLSVLHRLDRHRPTGMR
jgi:GTPase SAR1 family protein